MFRVSPQPMPMVPVTVSLFRIISCSAFSASSRISCARRRSSRPSSVSVTLTRLRRNRRTPSSSSSCIICRDSVGWVMCSCSAARVMFSSLAIVRKYFSTRISITFSVSLTVFFHDFFNGFPCRFRLIVFLKAFFYQFALAGSFFRCAGVR